jgi:putative hydrolase of the HAD superfamily
VSIVAEFAQQLHEQGRTSAPSAQKPLDFPFAAEKLFDVRAVIFDVYGTLVDYWKPEFATESSRQESLLRAFGQTAEYFKMNTVLQEINPQETPDKTLHGFYHGLIALQHEKSLRKGIAFPEVRIESVWQIILMMLQRHGYDIGQHDLGDLGELARCVGYYYHFQSLGRGLFPGVVSMLTELKAANIRTGIVSNGQFYTPIDLSLFVRDQSEGAYDDYLELFEPDFVVFSYELGMAKPNQALLRKLFDAFFEYQILPAQTVFAGNDLSADIIPAQDAGMKTAFFTGDSRSTFLHDCAEKVVPDLTIRAWDELADRVSFYEQKE